MSIEGTVLRTLRGMTTDKAVVGEERLEIALLYLCIGLVLLWVAMVVARVPLGRMPANPLRWHRFVWNEAAANSSARFYTVILLSITSVCYLVAPLFFWLRYLFFES